MSVFEGIIGHGNVRRLLARELEGPAHAYLFVGPSNVGKATVARRFAEALVGSGDPGARRRAREGNHPDLVVVEPEGRTAITVDQARRIVAAATRPPREAAWQVFLLEEADLLNDEAANALLKTLEEPTATTVFVLVAESETDLPSTIGSRCRTVVFGRVPEQEVRQGLEALGTAATQAANVAVIAGGRPGLAIALATQPEVARFRSLWLGLPARLSAHPGEAYRLAEEVMAATDPLLRGLDERHAAELAAAADPKALEKRQGRERRRAADALYVSGLEILASFYRDAAAAQLGAPARNRDVPAGTLTAVSPRRALASAARVLQAIEALHANQRVRLALASLFVDLADA